MNMEKSGKEGIIHASAVRMAEQYNTPAISMYGDALRLPSRQAVIEIIRDFQKLLFPVYYGDRYLLKLPPEQYCELLMNNIYDKLLVQIEMTLEEGEESHQRACEDCTRLLERLPEIQKKLQKDLDANYMGDPAAYSRQEVMFSYPGFFAIFVYRIAHELYIMNVPMIPRIMTEYAHSQTGIDINPGAKIGEYFFIDHGTGIVVGETTVIGNNVRMYQGVTLGALAPDGLPSDPYVRRHPKIGNDVVLYAGSTLLGGKTEVGDHVVIGGNAFLTTSVEPNTTVSIKKPEMTYREKRY